MIPLIDADVLVYRSAFAAQQEIIWDETATTTKVDFDQAKDIFRSTLDEWLVNVDHTTNPVICLSDSEPCFRRDLYPAYKANRKGRPALYQALRDWCLERFTLVYVKPRLEADDVLGILSTSKVLIPGKKVVISPDKDLKTVPGYLAKPGEHPQPISEYVACYQHMLQTLTGDSVDNFPGCPGIGPVKAAKSLDLYTSAKYATDYWEIVVHHFEAKGLTEADAILQARLARILHASDYDFKKKEPILWNPPIAQ